MFQLIVKSPQLTDIEPCLNKHANMTLVVVPGPESRSVIGRDWNTLLRNSTNNMLTNPLYDGPRANFTNNHCAMKCRDSTSCPHQFHSGAARKDAREASTVRNIVTKQICN
jgi:hypothetical protein